MEFGSLYTKYKPLLINFAYRMTGSMSDAEDIVQDLFASMVSHPIDDITDVKSYLIRAITNRSINLLKSSRRTREQYIGEWLPEPLIDTRSDPSDLVERTDKVTYAFMVLLEHLPPLERAVFILRETLGYEYHEIADLVNKSEVNCRKLFSRAKGKIRLSSFTPANHETALRHALTFLQGVDTGDFKNFINLMQEHAVMTTDGGGKVRAALKPIVGREKIARFLHGLLSRGYFNEILEIRNINDQAGIVKWRNNQIEYVVVFNSVISNPPVQNVFLISNPDKLREEAALL